MMTDARRPSREVLFTAVRRFWVVALVAGLAAGIATGALVRGTATTTWSGEATYVVPVSAPPIVAADGSVPPADPRVANSTVDAVRLASIYALLLVEDGDVLDVLAQETGLGPDQVAASTEALPVPDSPIVRVAFSSADEATVLAYFTGLERVLSERPALASTIRPGTLEPLREVQTGSSSGFGPLALVLGVLVGLGVGLGGAVMLERADPRLRSAADVRQLAAWPVLPLPAQDDDPRVLVLVQRILDSARPVRSVAVVGIAGTTAEVVEATAARLQGVHDRFVDTASGAGDATGTQARPARVEWVPGGELTRDGAAESLVQQVDAVLLLGAVGVRLSRLDGAVTTLQDLAVDPVVVALTARPVKDAGAGRTSGAPAEPMADPVHWTNEHDTVAVSDPAEADVVPPEAGASAQQHAQGHDQVSPRR